MHDFKVDFAMMLYFIIATHNASSNGFFLLQHVCFQIQESVTATCAYTRAIDRSSCAGYRSILVLTSLANTRDGQSERRLPPAPIRTPEW